MKFHKHTPGPWEIAPYAGSGRQIYGPNSRGICICGLAPNPFDPDSTENDPDAHLIAAAPDMLAALERAAVFLDDIAEASMNPDANDAASMVRAAIAKATGGQP